jgi:hypothetical protein
MNLYLISQDENDGYGTYDSAVVCAPDEETAKMIHPNHADIHIYHFKRQFNAWCSDPKFVSVKFLGLAHPEIEQGVVLASFNAG